MSQPNPSTEHPDLNQLAALSENSLPASERESVLLHLSGCGECRDLLHTFAAVIPESSAQPQPVPAPTPPERLSRRTAWRLPLFAAAGLAACAGIVMSITHHPTPPPSTPEVARLERPTTQPAPPPAATPNTLDATNPAAPPRKTPAPLGPPPPTVTLDEPLQTTPSSIAKAAPLAGRTADHIVPNSPRPAAAAAQSIGIPTGSVAPSTQESANAASHSAPAAASSGTALARAAGVPVTTPPAITGQDLSPEKDKSSNAPLVGQVNESVTVDATPIQIQTTETAALGNAKLAFKKSPMTPALPSGLPIASTLRLPEATLALDTAGALFRSPAAEPLTWQPVGRQWTGTAKSLRRPAAPTSTLHAAAAKSTPPPSSTIELLTADGHVFVSNDDGRNWHPHP